MYMKVLELFYKRVAFNQIEKLNTYEDVECCHYVSFFPENMKEHHFTVKSDGETILDIVAEVKEKNPLDAYKWKVEHNGKVILSDYTPDDSLYNYIVTLACDVEPHIHSLKQMVNDIINI